MADGQSYGAVPPPGAGDFMAALARVKEIAARAKKESEKKRPLDDGEESHDSKRPMMQHPGQQQPGSSFQQPGGGYAPQVEHYIPNGQVGRVIGKSGETINRLQAESGCRIQITQDLGQPERLATLSGSPEAIERAKRMIDDIVQESGGIASTQMGGGGGGGEGVRTVEKMIPADKVGLVIGRSGETIKRLQQECGCRMQMIQEDPYAQEKPLQLTGTDNQIRHAHELVDELITDRRGGDDNFGETGGLSLDQFQSERIEMQVPRFAVGSVIGRGGETIKRVQAETGARIQFEDDAGGENRIATISGTTQMVGYAEEEVKRIIDDCAKRNEGGGGGGGSRAPPPGHSVERYPVPANRCGLVIGRQGVTIKEIQAQSQARVELDRDTPQDAPEKIFVITGIPSQIEEAKRMIKDKVEGNRNFGGYQQQQQQQYGGYPQQQQYGGYPQQGGQQGYYQPPQQQQQQQPPADGVPVADDIAVALGYPTKEQYQQNQPWYNQQGYFGMVPKAIVDAHLAKTGGAKPPEPSKDAQPPPPNGGGQQGGPSYHQQQPSGGDAQKDYSKEWAAYYAAQAAQGGQQPRH